MIIISRKEAKQKGLKYYFTGKPCKKGHMSKRYIKNSCCYECNKQHRKNWYDGNPEYNKEYYEKNIEQLKQDWMKYYEQNKEQVSQYHKTYYKDNIIQCAKRVNIWYYNNLKKARQYSKDWRNRNPESPKQYYILNVKQIFNRNKKWRKNNPHKVLEYSKLRNTRLEQAIPIWYEESLVKQIYLKRDELNRLWGTNFVVDHIIPLSPQDRSVSGLHCWANLQLLDSSLNSSKKDVYQTDW